MNVGHLVTPGEVKLLSLLKNISDTEICIGHLKNML